MEQQTDLQDRLLTTREVEQYLGVSYWKIYRMVCDGEFPAPIRLGPNSTRFRLSEVEGWLVNRPRAAWGGKS